MLHYDGTISDPAAGNDVTDANLDDIAATQFAVDREVKERSVPEAPVLVKPEPNSPNLLWFEGALCAPHTAFIPGAELSPKAIERAVAANPAFDIDKVSYELARHDPEMHLGTHDL